MTNVKCLIYNCLNLNPTYVKSFCITKEFEVKFCYLNKWIQNQPIKNIVCYHKAAIYHSNKLKKTTVWKSSIDIC